MRTVSLLLALSMSIIFIGILLMGAGMPLSAEAAKAQKVLDRMANAYAKCKSYHDTGVVETIFFEGNRKRTERKPFTTAFVRPDQFRFEYKTRRGDGEDEFDSYIIWKNGNDIRTWWDIKPGVEEPKSLGSALGAAAGVSGNSSNNVPYMLVPKEAGGMLNSPKEPKQLDDAKLGDIECHRIEGNYGGQLKTLWIDSKTFLLRRIESKTTFEKFRTETTTSYNPAVDEEILEKKLEFNIPKR
jgi:outer membrane lipoprotein-sorting protein